jgi:hypothetical protein
LGLHDLPNKINWFKTSLANQHLEMQFECIVADYQTVYISSPFYMKLSKNIQALLEENINLPLSIGKLLEHTGEHAFGMISGLLTLPLMIPIPVPLAGFSTLLGSGVILMGFQLALGFRQPWLPPAITHLELSPIASQKLLKNINRVLLPLERLAQPRLLRLSHSLLLRRLLGLCLAWNATLMALPLPIPFTNLLPAYTILFLVIGTLEFDGLFLLIGYGMTVTTTCFFVSIANLIWDLLLHVTELFTNTTPQ